MRVMFTVQHLLREKDKYIYSEIYLVNNILLIFLQEYSSHVLEAACSLILLRLYKSNKNISYCVHVIITIKLINYKTSMVCGTYIN